MTVSSTVSRIIYTGNGATTSFSFPYSFLQASDIVVQQVDLAGVTTTLTSPTDYSVSGSAPFPSGSNILMVVAPPLNYKLVLARVLPFTQTLDLVENDPLPAEEVEAEFDRIVYLLQQLNDALARTPKLALASTFSNITFPDPLANAVIGWNAGGTDLANYLTISSGLTPVTPYMATVLLSIDAGTARAALNATTVGNNLFIAASAAAARATLGSTTVGDAVFIAASASAAQTALGVSTFVKTLLDDVDAATARTTLGAAATSGVRIKLTADTSFYVATTGSDSNDGLTVGTPWLTLQHAIQIIQANYDLAGFNANVRVANGTYAAGVFASGPCVGGDNINFIGDATTPSNVLISTSSAAFYARYNAQFTISGFKIVSSGHGVQAEDGGQITIAGKCEFGACTNAHMFANAVGRILLGANYTISGSAANHWLAQSQGNIAPTVTLTVTLTGTPAFTNFVRVDYISLVWMQAATFSGAATGQRYAANGNGVINSGGGGASYFPGNSAGSTATGGQYI